MCLMFLIELFNRPIKFERKGSSFVFILQIFAQKKDFRQRKSCTIVDYIIDLQSVIDELP